MGNFLFILLAVLLTLPVGAGAEENEGAVAETPVPIDFTIRPNPQQHRPAPTFIYKNYAGLSELITTICNEAAKNFDTFYAPSVVMVKPFVFITETGEKRLTKLGVTMADQMLAMINNNQVNSHLTGSFNQDINGVLQEIDGYLRLHISGMNAMASRRSYTASIEMSEAIYRALQASYPQQVAATTQTEQLSE